MSKTKKEKPCCGISYLLRNKVFFVPKIFYIIDKMKRQFHYHAVWQGPCSVDWFRDRGLTKKETIVLNGKEIEVDSVTEPYSAGRVEIQGPDGYDDELAVPPMKSECWYRFSDYLWQLRTDEPKTLAELVEMFEQDSGRDIEFYEEV